MRNWLLFRLERLALHGPLATALLVLGLLALIAVGGGLAAFLLWGEDFGSIPEAIWWSLLRVSDQGYLEDDVEAGRPVALSLILSLSGAAFLIGGVAAVMTQWLTATLHRLGEGRTPVAWRGPDVVLGWTDRTPHLVASLLAAEPRQRVVVLVPEVGDLLRAHLLAALPNKTLLKRVVPRSGLATRPEHLARAGCARARAVVVPGSDVSEAREHGARWLRGLAALRKATEASEPSESPRLVIELGSPELEARALALLPGAEFVRGDLIAARTLVRALRLEQPRGDGGAGHEVLVLGAGGVLGELVSELRRQGPRVAGLTVVEPAGRAREWRPDEAGGGLRPRFLESDPEAPEPLGGLELARFDRVLFVADRSLGDAERADESTLAAAIGLASRAGGDDEHILAIVELLDPASAGIFSGPRLVHSLTTVEVGAALTARALGRAVDQAAAAE